MPLYCYRKQHANIDCYICHVSPSVRLQARLSASVEHRGSQWTEFHDVYTEYIYKSLLKVSTFWQIERICPTVCRGDLSIYDILATKVQTFLH